MVREKVKRKNGYLVIVVGGRIKDFTAVRLKLPDHIIVAFTQLLHGPSGIAETVPVSNYEKAQLECLA